MQITTESPDKTHIKLTISGEAKELADIKEHVLKELAQNIKNVPGFRKGKAPLAMVEKQINPDLLQTEYIEHAVNDLYGKAVTKEDMRVVGQPKIELTKFVPFDTLEFTAETEVIGKVKLGEYKNLKIKKTIVAVTEDDVNEVLSRLTARDAKKDEVTRAAKDGDEVIIDFTGMDTKTKDAIAGADGKEYPLIIGSNNFIPGFEPQLIGLKAGEEKSFDIVFPKDYGSKDLRSKKVTFAIKVHKVNSVTAPKLDDAFAAKVGPFKSISELRDDIKKQITAEREQSAEREYENELVLAVAKKTTVALPETLVNEQLDRIQQDERQNLMYRGLTWEEFLKSEDLTEEKYRGSHKEQAELRAKAGLALSEIADAEGITVEQAEFDAQLDALKQRYNDEEMRAQLTKPEGQREIVSRILTQKTLDRLKELNPAK